MFVFVSAPVDTPTLSLFPILPLARSLEYNEIGAKGAAALAAILNKTQITDLKCAAAPQCSFSCQRPLTRLLSHCFQSYPSLAASNTMRSEPRVLLRSLPSSTRRGFCEAAL